MNIYIGTDLEGASGAWRGSQVSPEYPSDYAYGRGCLTRDVNTVIGAAFDQGAESIVVCDGHGPGGLDWEDVDPRVTLEKGGGVFPSLGEDTDCLFSVGRHAMAGTMGAFLEHTQTSRDWFEFRINGVPQGEMGIMACYAGHFGAPLALVTGDRAACEEAHRLFPEAATAEVKHSVARQGPCSCRPAAEVEKLLRERTVEAMDRVRSGQVVPFQLTGPITLELTYQRVDLADALSRRNPRWQRVDGRTLRCEVERQNEIYCW